MNTMNLKNALICLALVGSTALVTATVVSQDKPGEPEWQIPPETMQKMQPGANHKKLDPYVGKWNQNVKMWMDPASEPTPMTGTAEYEWVLDGRYIKGKYSGDMGGMPFQGLQFLGHDNNRGEYVSVWMDNMGTDIYTSKGQMKGSALTMTGKMDDCMSGRNDVPFREVTTFTGKDQMKFEMFSTDESGKEIKVMEIVSTRVN
jgi:hypothetical protein